MVFLQELLKNKHMIISAGFSNIKQERMNAILRTVLSHKRITRKKLAELLNLSQSSIVKYVKDLNDIGLVKETTKTGTSLGRKSVYIEINNEIGVNLAIVLNASHIKGVLIDLGGVVIDEYIEQSFENVPKDVELEKLYLVIVNLLKKASQMKKKIFGIGLAMGGFIDPKKGISHDFLYATGWYDVPLAKMIESRFHLPCFLVNDANAYAMGDKFYGLGLGYTDFFTLKIDEGIGMGIIINGNLYLGGNNYSGELGHNKIQGNRAKCYCGLTGCLETICSKNAILEACQKELDSGVHSDILRLMEVDHSPLTFQHIVSAANNGDRLARNLFRKVGKAIASKLSDIVNVFNPQLIVFRGEVIDGNEFLFETFKQFLSNQVLRHTASHLVIKYSEKSEDIDMKGINAMILMDFFTKRAEL